MSVDSFTTKEIDDMLQLVSKIYRTILCVDLEDRKFHYLQSDTYIPSINFDNKGDTLDELVAQIDIHGRIYTEDAAEFVKFLDVETIKAKLAEGKKYFSFTYRYLTMGTYRWSMVEIMPSKYYGPSHQVIVICIRDLNEEHQQRLDKEAKLSAKERQLVGDKTVLVVDDSELQRATICYFLEKHYNTVEKENGQEALEYLKAHSTDVSVIIMDLNMPVMDGYGFLKEFLNDELLRMIPVLVLTSDDTPDEEENCLEAGATDFVAKPFNPEVLLSRIRRAIELHEKTVMLNVLRMDNQTECYNRDYFMHIAEQLLNKYPEVEFDVLCTHVVDLPNINEQYGAAQGQAILRYVANSYNRDDMARSVFGRLDDATFVQILPHSIGMAEKLKLEHQTELHEFSQARPDLPPFMQKYGVYECVDHSLSVRVMCDRAMMALDKIKNVYKSRIGFYDDSFRLAAVKRQQILESMEEAVTKRQFQVWYQPKHNIFTGELTGAEALVRWIHPSYGFMSPAEFIPIFEENGFVTHMDYYVWEESCAAINRWQGQGIKTVPISINISRKDFLHFENKSILRPLIEKYELQPSDLHLEVTESAYMDNPEVVIKNINALHKEGFTVELDDFGTGYSSLSMFAHMDIDVVKLDMSFIKQARSEQNDKMMQYIINMCKNLGIEVLSEGVETEEQRQRLLNMGCDYVQGYYYSKPLAEKDFIEYLRQHS